MANRREFILPQFRLQPLEHEGNNAEPLDFDSLDHWLENADCLRQVVEENVPVVFAAFRAIRKKYGEVVDAHNTLVDQVNELEATVQEKESGVQRLEGVTNYQQGKIKRLQTFAHTSVPPPPPVSPPTGAAAAAPLPPPAGISTGVAATPLSPTPAPTVPTSASSMGEKKSTKIPDPEVFTIGVKEPQFEHWLLQIESKLVANADHFPTEAQQMTYVQSRVGGNAMGHLAPRLRRNAVIRFTTAQQMLECLKAVYGNPNWKRNLRNKYRNLRQDDKDFNTFWAEFQRLAADLDHNEATLIDDLVHKSHHTIQLQLATGDELPTSLSALALHCQRIWQSLKNANYNQVASKRFVERKKRLGGTKATTTAPSASAPAAQTTPASRLARPYQRDDINRLTDDKKDKLRAAGRCWHCKEVGVHRPRCPNPFRPFSAVSAALNKVAVKAEESESENE